jgi:hypothetical protein
MTQALNDGCSIREGILYEKNHKFRFQQYLSEGNLAATRSRSPFTAGIVPGVGKTTPGFFLARGNHRKPVKPIFESLVVRSLRDLSDARASRVRLLAPEHDGLCRCASSVLLRALHNAKQWLKMGTTETEDSKTAINLRSPRKERSPMGNPETALTP